MVEIVVFLAVLGAAMGSFAGVLAARLHDGRNFMTGRSECDYCHHKLGPLDLIPIVSWLALRGSCRYCRKPLSPSLLIVEITLAVLFVVSYLYWPLGFITWQGLVLFVLWLVYLSMLAALFIYDLRWMLLPNALVFPLIGLGFVDAALRVSLTAGATVSDYVTHVVLGVMAMAGIYGALYLISKGKWVGLGDIKLAVFMGAVLGWQKTLLVLMLANVIGMLVVIPGLLTKKLNARSRVPFGPFLIVAFVLAGLFGDLIIQWYVSSFILL